MNTDSKQRAATFELALEYAVRRMIEIDALCHGTNYCPGCRDKHLDIEEAVECAKSHFLFEAKRALNKKNFVERQGEVISDEPKTQTQGGFEKKTDEEIFTALHQCGGNLTVCDCCPYANVKDCTTQVKNDIIARINGLKAKNATLHERRSRAELRAEVAEAELSRYTELLSKDEAGKATAKNILNEVYREVERVRMECEYIDKDGDYVMNSVEFVSEFTVGSLWQLYEKWGLDMKEIVKTEADKADIKAAEENKS